LVLFSPKHCEAINGGQWKNVDGRKLKMPLFLPVLKLPEIIGIGSVNEKKGLEQSARWATPGSVTTILDKSPYSTFRRIFGARMPT